MTETKDHADLIARLCDSVDLLRNFPTRPPVPGRLSQVDGRHLDVIQQEIEEAAQALTTQAARIAELEGALRLAATRFREYEALHAAKPDPVKAQSNADMAALCEAALEPKP